MDLPTPASSDQSTESPDSSMDSLNPEPSKQDGMDDPLLSPLFLFPGQDIVTSSSSNSSSQHSGSPRSDWVLPGSVWNHFPDSKPHMLDDLAQFNLNLNFASDFQQDQWSTMDMDTNISALMPDPPQHLSIDPSALHFEGSVYGQSQGQVPAAGSSDPMFRFTVSQPSDSTLEPVPPLQLPTPKPGSTSSRSVSPTLSRPDQDIQSSGVNPSDLSLFTQLGQKARDAVGIKLAVPADQGSGVTADDQALVTPVSPVLIDPQIPQPKVPIPRLRPSALVAQKSQLNPAALSQPTPPPSQSSSSPPSVPQEPAPAVATTKSGRPKTSHTTIERRYRTNLNARILALRRAVPALRILEKNSSTQTQGKGLTGASASKWEFDDVINERGYVDGVKAAKKNSKGVVLGKAVEYIKALKRRETRLRRESDGLRALLSGLVGGPELLTEWEKEWRAQFGGEETDEVDEDAEDNEEGEADVDEGDDAEGGDSDEEDGRMKKRARVEKKEQKDKAPPAPQTEKRKRGRPRKNPVSSAPAATPHLVLHPAGVQDQRQPSKYLLAAFLFFSFFNPNSPTNSSRQGHEGAVLTHATSDAGMGPVDASGWTTMQAVHMLVSVLLLCSLVGPYLPKRVTCFLPEVLLFGSSVSPAPSPASQKTERQVLSAEAISSTREVAISRALAVGDEQALRDVLGADSSLHSVVQCIGMSLFRNLKRVLCVRRGAVETMTRQEQMELRGWRRVVQMTVLCENASLLMQIQAYLSLSSRLPSSCASPSDNIMLALLASSFTSSTAVDFWESARHADIKTSAEALVLELDVEEAAKIVVASQVSSSIQPGDSYEEHLSPVRHIAAHVVLARAKALAASQFISSVSGPRIVDLDGENSADSTLRPPHNTDMKVIVAAGRELGGALGEVTSLLDKVDRCPAAEVLAGLPPLELQIESDDSDSSCSENASSSSSTETYSLDTLKDVRVMLLATLLYRRIFPTKEATSTHVLSPPPSPTPTSSALHLALRRALASAAFDTSPDTEDARDKVVDVLAETRRGRSTGLY